MLERNNLLGAVIAHVIFILSNLVFLARLFLGVGPGFWVGIPLLLMVFPLAYLLWSAPQFERPRLYSIQVALMLGWILVLFVLDYWLKIDFRQTQWMVITFVVSYFAALGGMIGISSLAGRRWMISAIVFFFLTLVLAFVQRAVTGY